MVLAGLLAYALSRLGLHKIGHALVSAKPGWVALAFALMGSSLLLRSISWDAVLRAALASGEVICASRGSKYGVVASCRKRGP